MKVIVFRIGTSYFGLEFGSIQGIVSAESAVDSFFADTPGLAGMLKIHNDMIPVLALHKRLRLELSDEKHLFYMIVSVKEKRLAIPFDGVENSYDVPPENLRAVPSMLRDMRWLREAVRLDGRLVLILDAAYL